MVHRYGHRENNGGKKALLGVGAVASLAGAYFLYGSPNAKQNREKVRGWALKAKGEVLEKLEKAREVTKEEYEDMIDNVLSKYEDAKNIDAKDLEMMGKDLKRHWKSFSKDIKKATTK